MLIAALIFVLLGILIKYGKMYNLIAGYNTLSKEEKEKYDIEGIATVFRNGMFGMAFFIALGYFLSKWLNNSTIQDIAFWGSFIVGMIYILVVSNSKRYRRR